MMHFFLCNALVVLCDNINWYHEMWNVIKLFWSMLFQELIKLKYSPYGYSELQNTLFSKHIKSKGFPCTFYAYYYQFQLKKLIELMKYLVRLTIRTFDLILLKALQKNRILLQTPISSSATFTKCVFLCLLCWL